MKNTIPATPAPATTMMLLRDGSQGIETFMVVRNAGIEFMGGAMVFPGGRVDPADHDSALQAHARDGHLYDPDDLALRIAGIRETFEEAGVLLARPKGQRDFVSVDQLERLRETYAAALIRGDISMLEFAKAESLEWATDVLVKFAHWITPEIRPKRFDTHFYLAPAPIDHIALHDGHESVDSVWTTTQQAFEDMRSGHRTIVFPTQCNLAKLGESPTVKEALSTAKASRIVTILPEFKDGKRVPLPTDAGYKHQEIITPKIQK
ncbi:MAG: NUDIX hydrolase [Gammaproteobacteria bacterium]|nr:NUDIX hydrolase [Gammaproteobacteria bacterium]